MVKENPVKHLEFIQNVITRMANNSFLLKGWTVTLVAALFLLAAQNANIRFPLLAFFPVIAFWVLDAYYLWQERLFRALYNSIRVKDEMEIHSDEAFYMSTMMYHEDVQSWARTMFSKTLFIFLWDDHMYIGNCNHCHKVYHVIRSFFFKKKYFINIKNIYLVYIYKK